MTGMLTGIKIAMGLITISIVRNKLICLCQEKRTFCSVLESWRERAEERVRGRYLKRATLFPRKSSNNIYFVLVLETPLFTG